MKGIFILGFILIIILLLGYYYVSINPKPASKEVSHFWYSQKQLESVHGIIKSEDGMTYFMYLGSPRYRFFARIEGELVEYTEMTEGDKNSSSWDDMKYLGKGYYNYTITTEGM